MAMDAAVSKVGCILQIHGQIELVNGCRCPKRASHAIDLLKER